MEEILPFITLAANSNCSETLEADEDLLLQVLLNILKNVKAASQPDDTVPLSCMEDDNNSSATVSKQDSCADFGLVPV
jgi:signal transduction histidine kinase